MRSKRRWSRGAQCCAARASRWRCRGSRSLAPRSRARAGRRRQAPLRRALLPERHGRLLAPDGGSGAGDAWKLSPILEPLAPVKQYLSVLTQRRRTTRRSAATSSRATRNLRRLDLDVREAERRRQREQRHLGRPGDRERTSAARRRCRRCRSASRRSTRRPTGCPASTRAACPGSPRREPLYKIVNPQAVFDRLVAGGTRASGSNSRRCRTRRRCGAGR